MRCVHMAINFGGGNVAMPEQHLKRAQVHSPFKQMSGKGVANDVRRNLRMNARCFGVLMQAFPEALPGVVRASGIQEKCIFLMQFFLRRFQEQGRARVLEVFV